MRCFIINIKPGMHISRTVIIAMIASVERAMVKQIFKSGHTVA
jgi:hypothetical protein